MPHPKDRKQRTRQRILDAAARLFRARGFDAIAIEDVMRECRLTRGGFYAHFRSKAQLYQEAVTGALAVAASVDDAALKNTLADACHRVTQALRNGNAGTTGEPTFLWAPDDADSAQDTRPFRSLH